MDFEKRRVVDVEISDEMRKSFIDYSMSVIVARALPDVRDGLKPVHRRILYTMHENSLHPEGPYRKCADTVGSVLGRYHPHGDASVYDALVRMAQSFSMRYMLVDGQGNFGSVDGDPPAAYRYTEAKLSKISTRMMTDIDKETVDFVTNYDDRLKEPSVLPSRYPNLLVNGSTGIAVGMATNIPPHNLREVINGMCCLIDNPEAELDELMEHIKGPDFPTAGLIMGYKGIRSAYATGRGKITVRARAEIQENGSRNSIVITELPYQVNKARLIESIADLVKDKRVEGIADIHDYSSKQGMKIQVDLKRDANAQVVLNQLYSFTQLQTTFGVIQLVLVDGQPKVLTLKETLQCYIKHQCEIIVRRTRYDLKKAQEKAHILEGFIIALDFIDEVIAILRASKNIPEGKEALMERFGLDDIQASEIVKMRLGQLTGMERIKIEEELAALKEKIREFLEILADEGKVHAIIKAESLEIAEKFGDDRRTEILPVSGEVDIEDLIPQEECVLTLTTLGYIKRQPVEAYHLQRRGGKGVKGMTRREEDIAETMFTCNTHDYIMFFTNFGKVYKMKCYEVPEGSRTSKGMNIVNLLPLASEEKVTSMIRLPDLDDDSYLCMVTRQGVIKRTKLSLYNNVRKGGIIAVSLDEGDELAWVQITDGESDLLVATRKGMCIRFNENDARSIGRTARGVRAIQLGENDEVVGMAVLSGPGTILTVSETGYGRRSEMGDFRVQSRGGKGVINYRVGEYGDVAAVRLVQDDEEIILISSDGIIIRVPANEISVFSRPAKGVRVMRLDEGQKLVTLTTTAASGEDEGDDAETAEGAPATEAAEATTEE